MRKLLQRALDVLDSYDAEEFAKVADLMADIRAELAKPEPEATVVAYSDTWFDIIEKYQRPTQLRARPPCSRHPDAPHGFDRTASHNADRHVCVCESWAPGEAS